jgi:hypothetical protein
VPSLSHYDANSHTATAARLRNAKKRGGEHVTVGTRLLGQLLREGELVARMRDAGWAIADDGDPYRPGGS